MCILMLMPANRPNGKDQLRGSRTPLLVFQVKVLPFPMVGILSSRLRPRNHGGLVSGRASLSCPGSAWARTAGRLCLPDYHFTK